MTHILEIRYHSGVTVNHEYQSPWAAMAAFTDYMQDAEHHKSILKITIWPKG